MGLASREGIGLQRESEDGSAREAEMTMDAILDQLIQESNKLWFQVCLFSCIDALQ